MSSCVVLCMKMKIDNLINTSGPSAIESVPAKPLQMLEISVKFVFLTQWDKKGISFWPVIYTSQSHTIDYLYTL